MINFFKGLFQTKPISTLPKIFVVSFPRSGHHALIGFLSKVSDFSENYCEFYSCSRHNGEAIECKNAHLNYRLKRNSCAAGNSFLKSHDFDLKLPYKENNKYIVQFRHPFYSIKSWYEMENEKGHTTEEWPKFFENNLKFWQKFVKKWIIKYGDKSNILIVDYDTLREREVILKIADFSGANIKADIVNFMPNFKANIRVLEDENGFYQAKEAQIKPLLDTVGIKPLFN